MKHVDQRIQAYLDGELAPAAAAELQEHLRECADCRQRLEAARRCWQLVDIAVAPPLRRSVWPRVEAVVARRRGLRAWSWPQRGLAATAAAAGVVLGMQLGEPAATDDPDVRYAGDGATDYLEASLPTLDQLWLQLGDQAEDAES
ncbi:MAG TPA: zf-HC2 domain-containing protein [Candidatus Krumholzibacteria bacterium]|nr:zf-HC2 domain-containing protein [Candidatus Krumholzibacteria bacterium]HPD71945.1 zf-HC2 domain-containing protein [Candidatus Krumholzibacteria bacterium]HRY41122.1 zf-HC2 domain-containing protein [Candidatus Krumholzibacteria bacterium]